MKFALIATACCGAGFLLYATGYLKTAQLWVGVVYGLYKWLPPNPVFDTSVFWLGLLVNLPYYIVAFALGLLIHRPSIWNRWLCACAFAAGFLFPQTYMSTFDISDPGRTLNLTAYLWRVLVIGFVPLGAAVAGLWYSRDTIRWRWSISSVLVATLLVGLTILVIRHCSPWWSKGEHHDPRTIWVLAAPTLVFAWVLSFSVSMQRQIEEPEPEANSDDNTGKTFLEA